MIGWVQFHLYVEQEIDRNCLKIKSFRIIKMFKKIGLISILAFLICFSLARPAYAQFGIWDYADAIEGFLDFGDPFIGLLIKFALICMLSLVYILLAAALLQWAIAIPVNLGSSVVVSGWHFVLGLVNLFFILALLAIAFAYLLRIESFQVKKTFPRLILVILLVNFSLLLVGMVVDVSEFFMNTLRDAYGGNFVELAILNLRTSVVSLLAPMLIIVGGYLVSTLSVYGAIPVLIGIIIGFTSGAFTGMLFQSALFIVFNLVLGSIFFLYFILFLARIVALWLLAIFSPIAFFCLIFPQTQQYAKKWFRALIQWAFMGVVALFLLGLITVTYTEMFSGTGAIKIGSVSIIPGFSISNSVYNYLFMMIFLGVAWYATKKYVPVGASEGLALLQKSRGVMTGRVMNFAKKVTKGEAVQKLSQSMSQVRSSRDYYNQEMAGAKGTAGKAWVGAKSFARAPFSWATKGGGEHLQAVAAEEKRMEMGKAMKSYEGASIEKTITGVRSPNRTKRIAALEQARKDGVIDILKKKGVSSQETTEIMAEAMEHEPSTARDLKKGLPNEVSNALRLVRERKGTRKPLGVKGLKGKELEEAMEKIEKETGLHMKEEDIEKYGTLRVKIIAEMKGGDFAKLGEDTIEEALIKIPEKEREKLWANLNPEQLSAAAREHKGKITDIIRAQSLAYVDFIKKNNKKLYDYLDHSSGAHNAGLAFPKEEMGEEKTKADRFLREAREKAEERKEPVVSMRKGIKEKERRARPGVGKKPPHPPRTR